ncbi:hypothetical protein KI387_008133, partial [Taxus chinensis]
LILNISQMMKGKKTFGWCSEGKESFEGIKRAIAKTPVLACPDFRKDFIIYCYATDNTLVDVLTQEDSNEHEIPIAFMSYILKDHELKYTMMETFFCS